MISDLSCGQFFVIGFPGIEPSNAFLDFVTEEQIGGVILFADNCTDPKRLPQHLDRLQDCTRTGSPLLVAIDQEGGRVCRLRGNPAEFGSAADYGAEGTLDSFTKDYTRAVKFMAELGININLAPVADLDLNPDNSCLAGRSFGDDPEKVAAFVALSVRIAHEQGLRCCLKHFPGLGDAAVDPHKATAVAAYDEKAWRSREAIPFEAGIKAGADLVMTTHLQLPQIGTMIATGSDIVAENWLRDALGFEGALITDDLNMLGAGVLGSPGERALAAFRCGHDLLLFGPDFDASRQAFYEFKAAFDNGTIDSGRLEQAAKRVACLRKMMIATGGRHAT